MNTSPSITVIVIAHNRREFLGEALQSIARQTLDRDRYEVLLVKDFHDSSIDALCDKLAIEPIYTTAASTSGMFLEGFERCLLYTSPSPRDPKTSRMPSSA